MTNTKKLISLLLVLVLVLGQSLVVSASPSSAFITTPATGYDSADDVVYKTYKESNSNKTIIANWGARGEECVFLSKYAQSYYTSDYTWDVMSDLPGGTSQSNAPSSTLYKELQELMADTHTYYTYYEGNKNVRWFYKYTDCVNSDISKVALLYRGGLVSSAWDQGKTWNQEHVWPKSKLSTDKQIGDIMHLRPANPSENSSRGNTAYGSYYPGDSVRGDCARMVLYMYVRWGVTGTMWGGAITDLNTLLSWMEADPVDTWEMGRNDSVQSITGVRNVFVDYPEYAWLLFGRDVPENMTTPSGAADDDVPGSSTTPTTPEVTEPTTPPVTEPPVTEPPVTEPPATQPPVTEPPVTEPPVTEPPATQPPVTDPSTPDQDNCKNFKDAMGRLMTSNATGEDRFELISNAVNAYNAMSDAERATVPALINRLKSEIADHNQTASVINSDLDNASGTFITAAIITPTLAYAVYCLLGKKFF